MAHQIFIAELEELIGRNERTIRTWIRDARKIAEIAGNRDLPDGYLPVDLWPDQECVGRRRIFWREGQVVGLKDFADDKSARRGWPGAPS